MGCGSMDGEGSGRVGAWGCGGLGARDMWGLGRWVWVPGFWCQGKLGFPVALLTGSMSSLTLLSFRVVAIHVWFF